MSTRLIEKEIMELGKQLIPTNYNDKDSEIFLTSFLLGYKEGRSEGIKLVVYPTLRHLEESKKRIKKLKLPRPRVE